jgi:hypothetical protein
MNTFVFSYLLYYNNPHLRVQLVKNSYTLFHMEICNSQNSFEGEIIM